MKKVALFFLLLTYSMNTSFCQNIPIANSINTKDFDPSTLLWYKAPASVWEEAMPIGNGRLGAMVFGKNSEEKIQLNEETYWSGGPYSTVVKGGYKVLPEIQKNLFEGNPIRSEIVASYSNKSGRDIHNIVFYYAFGLFKIAVIAQQIYYRYSKGLTSDPRFANLDKAAELCCNLALKSIKTNSID